MGVAFEGIRRSNFRPDLLSRKMGFGIPGAVCFNHEPRIGGPGAIGGGRPLIPSARFNKKGLTELFRETDLRGKRVIVRADFNVLDPKTGKIKSDSRIRAGIQTLKELKAKSAEIIILTHNDDPVKVAKKEGIEVGEVMKRLSNRTVAERLTELLREEGVMAASGSVAFVNKLTGSEVEDAVAILNPGDILMLENTRMDARDVKGDIGLAREIFLTLRPAAYVIDGFSVMHRDQATVTGLARTMKDYELPTVAGRLVEKEIDIFGRKILDKPEHPFVLFSGGAKVSGKEGKIEILKRLIDKVDKVVIGGAMLYAFLKAEGHEMIGSDPLNGGTTEEDIAAARELLATHGKKIILPKTLVFYNDAGVTKTVNVMKEPVEDTFKMGDVAASELIELTREIPGIRTAILNGDFGYTSHPDEKVASMLYEGSFTLLDWLAEIKDSGGVSAAGGGDTGKLVREYVERFDQNADPMTLLSTGGGAMTALLAEGTLPGIEVIDNKI
jgi:phosphoglycerate kinase